MFSTDAASDAITHFIGLFELAELKARLRLDYDELAAIRAEVGTGSIATLDHDISHTYIMHDVTVGVRYTPPPAPTGGVENGTVLHYPSVPLQALAAPAPYAAPAQLNPTGITARPDASFELTLPAPGSLAVVTIQKTWLSDNDMLDADRMEHVAPEVLAAELDALAQMALEAGIASELVLPASEADFVVMAQQLRAVAAPEAEGARSVTGDAAHGTHLNGEAGAERPEIDDLLPTTWKEKAARAESEDEGATAGDRPVHADGPAPDDGPTPDDAPTHEIVHGANLLVNEVVLTASWISAPVIAVAGDSCSVDLISQVNVWQDVDTVVGLAQGDWDCAPGETHAYNFASLAHRSYQVQPAEADGGPPALWAVTTIEGSLINFNWIEQRNFVSDSDVTSITLTGASTTMIFGANEAVNAVSLFELGTRFDLIIVDGNLINLAAIFQTNVLLDSDLVTLHDGGGTLSMGDNLLLNDASIEQVGVGNHVAATGAWQKLLNGGPDALSGDILDDPAFAGIDVLRVLHVKGDLVSAQIIEQLNILGDADQVNLLAARAMENAADVSVVTGSNVLVNSAHVAEFGLDSTIHTGGGIYSDALIHQAELVDTGAVHAAAGLASEAVLFLAEGMAGTIAAAADEMAGHMASLDTLPIDPMQTVLA